MLGRPVEIFREARDGGQDAVFLIPADGGAAAPIGTVQCKYSSTPGKALRTSDLSIEIAHVKKLVRAGQADAYVFMTNMSVDAPVAVEIRAKLRKLGVRKPHVLGKQYIVRSIRSSARLRAMVPQVYGLGDLTAIVDERVSEQSRALLDHWIPKLKNYVPTRAHRDAVNAINDLGIVLLLGNPSSGKSAIGAIISTIASENLDNTVLALTSPRDFEAGWNPNDPGRFFWIDDAFGSNVLRDDYVQDWTAAFQKLRAAIGHGNRFLLTSRKHIYEAAKRRLGQRNLAEFVDGRAVVDVGVLSPGERAQILYNHINFGGQSQSWKSSVKPHLDAVAGVDEFLPGIAERLGDPNFTKSLAPREASLVRFMREPREHLIDTVNALDEVLQAALMLVYVHQGNFNMDASDRPAVEAVAELAGFSIPQILGRFSELKGSFLKTSGTAANTVWSFAHPTIADALTEILREKPFMMPALLRGATIDTILTGFTCEGAMFIQDALSVPASLNETLVTRLAHTPNEVAQNWSLFSFLVWRANNQVFKKLVQSDPDLLERNTWNAANIGSDPRMAARARAHRAGLLDGNLRERAADILESAAITNFDLSFFDSEELLELIPAERLVRLGIKLRNHRLPKVEDHIVEIADEANLDEDPESHFERVTGALDLLERMDLDPEGAELIDLGRKKIEQSIENLVERKEALDSETADDSDWTHIVTTSASTVRSPRKRSNSKARSIFDDVDQ